MVLLLVLKRNFSQTSRILKYSHKSQKEKIIKAKRLLHEGKLVEGMNTDNTNYLEIGKQSERALELKPIQHPVNINEADSNIVSYKVPPKNLTPYYQVPVEAFAQVIMKNFESPQGSRQLDVSILGAPNAGKSTIVNYLVGRNISAVSNKTNTTDDAVFGYFTDYDEKAQIKLIDTPGVTKANNSMKSNLLISKAWDNVDDSDMVMFVVDSVRKLDSPISQAIKRLKSLKVDPVTQKIMDQIKDGSFSEDRFIKGQYEMNDEEMQLHSLVVPAILVMNKVDLVTNKMKFRELQNELEDMGEFEKIFHISAETGFGMDQLKSYLLARAKPRPWSIHPEVKSTQSEVEKAEEAMKQAIFEKFFKEIPHQVGIKVVGWTPKLNGELRIDFHLDVKNDIQIGMLLGEGGRIIKEVRERATQILIEKIQRPVMMTIDVVKRKRDIANSNRFDSFNTLVRKERVRPSQTRKIE